MFIPPGTSATAIQTSPTTVEVVVYGDVLVRLKFSKCYRGFLVGMFFFLCFLLWCDQKVNVVVKMLIYFIFSCLHNSYISYLIANSLSNHQ